jgi:thiol-disulfide isomerase/thioredoxin
VYALGAGLPLLAIALLGRGALTGLRAARMHAHAVRRGSGLVLIGAAVLFTTAIPTELATAAPGFTSSLQKVERSADAAKKIAQLTHARTTFARAARTKGAKRSLRDYGPAPQFAKISAWLNTPGGKPLSMTGLRGKVVLVDFWTYSCINCLRTLPQLEAWDARYRAKGLVIVGVHTPEFAFEHKASNVSSAIKRLGVKYPVVQDNDFATWNAYSNQYWPAEYMIDKSGHVRHAHFGEGEYQQTEKLLRRLLGVTSAPMTNVKNTTPSGLLTPESYLGTARIDRVIGDAIHAGVPWTYEMPKAVPQNNLAYGGRWTIEKERAVAVKDARLRLRFSASKVYLVLGGHGSVDVLVDGKPLRTVRVDGDRLYTLVDSAQPRQALLELRFAPGISGYAFTFG